MIVIFGFPSCGGCVLQKNAIPKNYAVLKVNHADRDAVGASKPTWRDLMKKWEVDNKVLGKLAPVYPTTVMVENGIPTKIWRGFKPWRIIKPHVEKAKTSDDKEDDKLDETDRNRRRLFRLDFRFNRNRQRGHQAQFGRWSQRSHLR